VFDSLVKLVIAVSLVVIAFLQYSNYSRTSEVYSSKPDSVVGEAAPISKGERDFYERENFKLYRQSIIDYQESLALQKQNNKDFQESVAIQKEFNKDNKEMVEEIKKIRSSLEKAGK
jgi:hypothetical protein